MPGGLLPSIAQVVGRNHLLLVALQPIHEVLFIVMLFMIVSVTECGPSHNRSLDSKVHTHWLVTTLFLSWSAIELVRYPFYALSLWNKCPYVLEWLRYSRSPLCVIESRSCSTSGVDCVPQVHAIHSALPDRLLSRTYVIR